MKKSKSQVLKELEPIIPAITQAFFEAFEEYKKVFLLSGIAVKSENRSVANNVFDQIWSSFESRFQGRQFENIFIRKRRGVKFLQYHDYILRVKKIDDKGRAHNVETENSSSFFNSLFDFSLFNNEKLEGKKGMNLTIGYIANDARTEFSFPYLIHPIDKKNVDWMVNLRLEGGDSNVVLMPKNEPISPTGNTGKVRAKNLDKIDTKKSQNLS
ncbi:hypothetical protein P3G55_17860 [Leptospira sp. 96542]|nr:hypothetical protein [Leptospira sp. 96542]